MAPGGSQQRRQRALLVQQQPLVPISPIGNNTIIISSSIQTRSASPTTTAAVLLLAVLFRPIQCRPTLRGITRTRSGPKNGSSDTRRRWPLRKRQTWKLTENGRNIRQINRAGQHISFTRTRMPRKLRLTCRCLRSNNNNNKTILLIIFNSSSSNNKDYMVIIKTPPTPGSTRARLTVVATTVVFTLLSLFRSLLLPKPTSQRLTVSSNLSIAACSSARLLSRKRP